MLFQISLDVYMSTKGKSIRQSEANRQFQNMMKDGFHTVQSKIYHAFSAGFSDTLT